MNKPSTLQYFMKSNTGVYKATNLVNQVQFDKNSSFYDKLIDTIQNKFKARI